MANAPEQSKIPDGLGSVISYDNSSLNNVLVIEKSIYIGLALVVGPVVCGVAQKVTLIKLGILHKPLGDGEYLWLCVPFIFLSVYLAIKMAKLSINKIRTMWCFAVVTAFVIYLNAFIFMEMHELEGQRISRIGISPRNAPFSCCYRFPPLV